MIVTAPKARSDTVMRKRSKHNGKNKSMFLNWQKDLCKSRYFIGNIAKEILLALLLLEKQIYLFLVLALHLDTQAIRFYFVVFDSSFERY